MQPIHEVIPLAGSVEELPMARAAAETAFRRARCSEELTGDALLCLSELITNAVLHAGGPICVEIIATATALRLEVTDRVPPLVPGLRSVAAARAALVDTELERETGRGLAILAQLSHAWGVAPAEVEGLPGKLVWAELVADGDHQPLAGRPEGVPPGPTADGLAIGAEAVLLAVPIRLYLASEAHLEALLREMQLLAADWSSRNDQLVKSLAKALRRNASARATSMAEAKRRIGAGHDVMTIRFPVSPSTPADAQEFLEVVTLSEALTGRGGSSEEGLATELRHFRRWYVAELIHQAVGGAARPCPFRP